MATIDGTESSSSVDFPNQPDFNLNVLVVRVFGWSTITILVVFLLNNFLTFWAGWPGVFGGEGEENLLLFVVQAGLYAVAVLVAIFHVLRNPAGSLHIESKTVSELNAFLIRTIFWSVLLIGIVDMSLALLEVEQLMDEVFGKSIALDLVRQNIRAQYVHLPLILSSLVIASFTRNLGFPWLALLLVVVELLIVMFRFIFSYEQTYMSDLARFWYAALFLLAIAGTFREDAHVRVDVLFTRFRSRTRSLVNAFGTLIFGMSFCWVILVIGTAGKFSIFNAALSSLEKTDTGYGMYVQYLMTVLLGVFSILMLVQFVSYLFISVAKYYEHPNDEPAAS